jgi:DNA-binding XRE family transcriptional regulator
MNHIKDARISAGIKQIDLAHRLGISQGSLSMWENERSDPNTVGWISLAKILGVSVDYLMGLSSSPVLAPAVPVLSPDESSLLQQFRALPSDAQSRIRNSLHYEYQQYTGDAGKENNSISTKIG